MENEAQVFATPAGQKIVSMVVFDGKLVIATETGVFVKEGEEFRPVKFAISESCPNVSALPLP
jgi:hypothetical protein